MSGNEVDRYDVEGMIQEASYRYATAFDLRCAEQDLRDLRAEVDELRGLLADLTEAVHALLVPTSTSAADAASEVSP